MRIVLEERASLSPDALTGMEANHRFVGPETMETKIFGRLTAWQNWIFIRPNASGPDGALRRYGSGQRGSYDLPAGLTVRPTRAAVQRGGVPRRPALTSGSGDRTAVAGLGSRTLTYAELDERVAVGRRRRCARARAAPRRPGDAGDDRRRPDADRDPRRLPGRAGRGAGLDDVHRRRARQDHGRLGRPGRAGAPHGVRRRGRRGGRVAPDVEHVVLAGDGRTRSCRTGSSGCTPGTTSPTGAGDGPAGRCAGADRRRLVGAVALHLRHHRAARRRAMHRHANIRHVCETYGAPGARHHARRHVRSRSPSCSSPTASATRCSSRSRSARRPSSSRAGRRPDVVRRAAGAGPADAVLRRAHLLRRADRQRRTRRHVRVRAAVRLGGRAAPGAAAAALHRPVRGARSSTASASTEALHIFLSNRPGDIRPGTTGHAGARATTSRSATRRARWSGDGEPGAPARARRVDRPGLLAAHRRHAGRCSRASGWSPATPTCASADGYYTCLGRNNDMLKAGGIWVSPGRGGEPAAGAPGGRARPPSSACADADGLDKPVAAVVVGRGPVDGGRAGRLVPRRAGALQGAPRRWSSSTSCPRPRPASCSGSRCATWSAGRRPRPRTARRRRSPSLTPARRGAPMTAVEVDLLIVGAGPVGLYGAYYAGVRGLSRRRRRLAEPGRRPGHRDVPGEADLRRRRLPRGVRPRPGPRPGRAGRAHTGPTYLLGQEAQQLDRILDDGRPAGHHQRRDGDHLRRRRRHRRHRHLHAAAAARGRGVPRPRPGVLRARSHGVRRPRRRRRRRRRQRRGLGADARAARRERHRWCTAARPSGRTRATVEQVRASRRRDDRRTPR